MKTRIMFYEDNQVFRESMVRLFSGHPAFEVSGAFSSCAGIEEHVRTHHPDVVLMDIQMPGVNGLQGLDTIRSISPQTRVIMLTVFEDNQHIFEAICRGANGYLLKNATPSQIFHAIDEVLQGGAPLTPSIASKVLALLSNKKAAPVGDSYQLTPREKEILESLVEGNSYKMIGVTLQISIETVKTHIKRIYEKLQVKSQTEAVSKAMKEKIVGS